MPALIAFLTKVLLFIFTLKVIRFFMFGAILIASDDIVQLLLDVFLPEISDICQLLSSVPPELGFFLQYFEIPFAVNTVLSAYLTRFAIRRLPFIN
ncbi:DUF2523 family protein [Pasteurella canis]|uniref:DUF2523 family protein n=1 Tax=Pasteurella canis TaxID=753 RepID=UPI0013281947|nr:DUF2523 family protein [Pasteurella canis]MXN87701.1 DUF2523 domain-containing protein [Pasteurella canis]MXN87710.1 DUF2523 domain-containing protein [Pasteurella canis]